MVAESQNWETRETIRWLINDEYSWITLQNCGAATIRKFGVEHEEAPKGLYQQFTRPPASSFDHVDWNAVALSLKTQ